MNTGNLQHLLFYSTGHTGSRAEPALHLTAFNESSTKNGQLEEQLHSEQSPTAATTVQRWTQSETLRPKNRHLQFLQVSHFLPLFNIPSQAR